MARSRIPRTTRLRAAVAPFAADHTILAIRGERIIVDADLARLYGVSTKALNQAVKRNSGRFPRDFSFRLTEREKEQVVTNCDHLQALRYSSASARVLTEHGALMAASVLNSTRAVQASIALVRTFVRLRGMIASNRDLAHRLDELESRYDGQFSAVFEAIRKLMAPLPEPPRKRIGF